MAAVATVSSSSNQHIIPAINSAVEKVVAQGLKIHKIILEIMCNPWVPEKTGKGWAVYQQYSTKTKSNFFTSPQICAFDRSEYSTDLAKTFRKVVENLQGLDSVAEALKKNTGVCVEISCKAAIKSYRYSENGTAESVVTPSVNTKIEAFLGTPEWEQKVFGVLPATASQTSSQQTAASAATAKK